MLDMVLTPPVAASRRWLAGVCNTPTSRAHYRRSVFTHRETELIVTTILEILRHALGRDQYGRSERGGDYRNHFCAGEGSADFALCREAVQCGLMSERPPSQLSGGDFVFFVTDAGKAFNSENSPPPPRLTRGQKRYRRYIDADCDMKFGEWLCAERG